MGLALSSNRVWLWLPVASGGKEPLWLFVWPPSLSPASKAQGCNQPSASQEAHGDRVQSLHEGDLFLYLFGQHCPCASWALLPLQHLRNVHHLILKKLTPRAGHRSQRASITEPRVRSSMCRTGIPPVAESILVRENSRRKAKRLMIRDIKNGGRGSVPHQAHTPQRAWYCQN